LENIALLEPADGMNFKLKLNSSDWSVAVPLEQQTGIDRLDFYFPARHSKKDQLCMSLYDGERKIRTQAFAQRGVFIFEKSQDLSSPHLVLSQCEGDQANLGDVVLIGNGWWSTQTKTGYVQRIEKLYGRINRGLTE
jgi:hypothetical protein